MTSTPTPSLRVLAEQATSVKIRERLKQASDADRRYERPMTWDEAAALLDEIEALRKALISHAHDLIEHSEALSKAIGKGPVNGLYALPWNEISWGRDMANRAVETIEGLFGELCLECRGRGIIRNPDARYEMDNDTGAYETNDEEEIECLRCDGCGLEPARAALNGENT